jgi:stearoyl-CoA desaturase (delta-9 desaturase)
MLSRTRKYAHAWHLLLRWFDSSTNSPSSSEAVDYSRIVPFILLHVVCLVGVWFVPVGTIEIVTATTAYFVRMFAITGFYHRYFAHKSFETGRLHQFVWAFIGASSAQRGPIWWAATHRQHHRSADSDDDPHNSRRGFWWSHVGWFLTPKHFQTRAHLVSDWVKYPELRWIDRFDIVPPLTLLACLYALGETFGHIGLPTNGLQLAFWGFAVSTVVLLHLTLAINSLTHRFGTRAYDTADHSRNLWPLAVLTLGEGWHNNHHRYCGSARQGHHWWQIDVTFYLLWALSRVGLVKTMHPVPAKVLETNQ